MEASECVLVVFFYQKTENLGFVKAILKLDLSAKIYYMEKRKK